MAIIRKESEIMREFLESDIPSNYAERLASDVVAFDSLLKGMNQELRETITNLFILRITTAFEFGATHGIEKTPF